MLLGKEISKTSIAKILDITRSALYHFIETRKIVSERARRPLMLYFKQQPSTLTPSSGGFLFGRSSRLEYTALSS